MVSTSLEDSLNSDVILYLNDVLLVLLGVRSYEHDEISDAIRILSGISAKHIKKEVVSGNFFDGRVNVDSLGTIRVFCDKVSPINSGVQIRTQGLRTSLQSVGYTMVGGRVKLREY